MLVSKLERIKKENDNWELRKNDAKLKFLKWTKCANKMPIIPIAITTAYRIIETFIKVIFFATNFGNQVKILSLFSD